MQMHNYKFWGRSGISELGHFDKHFMKNTIEKVQGSILKFFIR